VIVIGALPTRFVSSHRPLVIFLLGLPASEDRVNRLAPNFSIAFLDGKRSGFQHEIFQAVSESIPDASEQP
jgi:hypothetical protein